MTYDKVRDERERDVRQAIEELAEIQFLVASGILGREQCPEPSYWRWQILKPDELPDKFAHFKELGEVRF